MMPLPNAYGKDLPDVYAVFAFYQYYPRAGWGDFYDAFPTLAEARASAHQSEVCYDGWQIVNLTTLSKIDERWKDESS